MHLLHLRSTINYLQALAAAAQLYHYFASPSQKVRVFGIIARVRYNMQHFIHFMCFISFRFV